MKRYERYTYVIYQVNADADFSFMGWEMANKHGWSFAEYHMVWNGIEDERDDYDLLNYLYGVFNLNHPKEFRGHSMSVGDIVRVWDGVNNVKYYYCDSFGWEDITDIIKKAA